MLAANEVKIDFDREVASIEGVLGRNEFIPYNGLGLSTGLFGGAAGVGRWKSLFSDDR